jgi:SpoVK/Ycf46/Vps4 family AAA+-type ATPase
MSHTKVNNINDFTMDDSKKLAVEFVHLAQYAMAGKTADATLLSRRVLRSLVKQHPELTEEIRKVVASTPDVGPARTVSALPVDLDSRMELVTRDPHPEVGVDPIWPEIVAEELNAIIRERKQIDTLLAEGLLPTRSLLLVGPPGVGKTLSARWLARQLRLPLLTLNLASVMSSYLGRTGTNIRTVIDHAQREPCVLLLDEFDSIAKRRDDATELGELKRLVTVLLQSIDTWSPAGLLIAATNHPELLDPAAWRRFERVVEFPLPTAPQIKQAIANEWRIEVDMPSVDLLGDMLVGRSFGEVERDMGRLRKDALLEGIGSTEALTRYALRAKDRLPRERLMSLARHLEVLGYSQRKVSEVTGIARDTLRKSELIQTRKRGKDGETK